ncbi:MAG: cyclic-di-AMP receptor [Clostridia bacterium]|nr:cyclic-di-AMP receptor [Clostridia bacterium]
MKLVIAIVQDEDASRLVNKLMGEGFGATKLATTGGFLRSGNTTLLTGVEDDKVPLVMEIIEKTCKSRKQMAPVHAPMTGSAGMYVPAYPVQVTVGGAIVFVLDVEQFHKF